MHTTILRLPAVLAQSGLSRSTLYSRISEGLWPPGVSLGPRAVGWPEDEVTAVLSALVAGKTDSEVRDLVSKIQSDRLIRDSYTA